MKKIMTMVKLYPKIYNIQIFLLVKDDYLFKQLSINDWNKLITRYENDNNAIVNKYINNNVTYVAITTTLYNIFKKHNIMDFRFIVDRPTKYHKLI